MLTPLLAAAGVVMLAALEHVLKLPGEIVAVTVALAAFFQAVRFLWRHIIVPPARILKALEELIDAVKGDSEHPGIIARLDHVEQQIAEVKQAARENGEATARVEARLSDGDEQFTAIEATLKRTDKVLEVVADEERLRMASLIDAATDRRSPSIEPHDEAA